MTGHSPKCSTAKSPECHCWCRGQFHGTTTGTTANWTPKKSKTRKPRKRKLTRFETVEEFQLGELVQIHSKSWNKHLKNKIAFVEEIVKPAYLKNGKIISRWHEGTYSLYGLEKIKFSADESFYYGDFKSHEIRSIGGIVTRQQLEDLKRQDPNNKGLARDVDRLIDILYLKKYVEKTE